MKPERLQDKPRVLLYGSKRKRYPYMDIDLWVCDYNFSPRGGAIWQAFVESYWEGLVKWARSHRDITKIGAATTGSGITTGGWFQVRRQDIDGILALLNHLLSRPWATHSIKELHEKPR